ncbi:MAG: hydroxymethylglutaryl-CoA reductase (NADPH) [Candidatus Micrarchaeia archaeon]
MDENNKTNMENKVSEDELLRKIISGEVPLYQIEKYVDPNKAVEIRRKAIASLTNTSLNNININGSDYSQIYNKNAENVIGMITVPMGIVGPLKIKSKYINNEVFVPLATTEGALIAGVNRGAKAITQSGGAKISTINDGMARAPVFSFNSIEDVERFLKWLPEHEKEIKEAAESTTTHGKLEGIKTTVSGNNVFLRFKYYTGDAMGMNMATIASEAASNYIEENFDGARLIAVSGNMCADKKPANINSLEGRGKTVIAEALITNEVLEKMFKANKKDIHNLNYIKNWIGSARAGSMTHFNAHFANIVAAIFLATGQDVAQVVESSGGYTITEEREEGLYISATLPSLEVGTVGGGTVLPTQKEALSIMGISGAGQPEGSNSIKLGEITAAAVLAGELNLLAALAGRELGKAHQKLGRSKDNK